ncbi:hypothetical protein N1031_07540 [Herbiconiux moechotypicola]|uniref:Uncharacterized protein n=1 Tax=Herbiconiux moechotypicola TaxID=637393 RepID=A0ABP5QEN9_9MICO|nr:hypothetical protein [Herbiconiux moechotypicola]MCS5729611.1 hypothetical protein [Herbiconiux moechotypicola]
MDVRKSGRRRVSTDAVPGSDPTPQAGEGSPVRATEDTDAAWGGAAGRPRASGASGAAGRPSENDERLKRDVPPHW